MFHLLLSSSAVMASSPIIITITAAVLPFPSFSSIPKINGAPLRSHFHCPEHWRCPSDIECSFRQKKWWYSYCWFRRKPLKLQIAEMLATVAR